MGICEQAGAGDSIREDQEKRINAFFVVTGAVWEGSWPSLEDPLLPCISLDLDPLLEAAADTAATTAE